VDRNFRSAALSAYTSRNWRAHTRMAGVVRTCGPGQIEYHTQRSDISCITRTSKRKLTPTQTSANLIGDFNFPPSGAGVVGRYCSGRAAIALRVVSAILEISYVVACYYDPASLHLERKLKSDLIISSGLSIDIPRPCSQSLLSPERPSRFYQK
jgi:hypothetical protein